MHVATFAEIKNGLVSDVYFSRTQQILKKLRIDKRVTVEFVVKSFPDNYNWGVLAGIEECVELLSELKVNVRSMPEGTIFETNQPVMVIEGKYLDFGTYETSLLGFICQASGIATKAARCKKAAGDKLLISFGARRMHPSIAPMIERNAYIGGCDGVAVIKSAEILTIEPTGTIPHALILLVGDTVKASQAFNEIIDKKVKRVALIDTINDEKFEALNVAEALGNDLFAVRLDTPGNRRGDFLSLLKEVRWELDLRGFHHVKLFVSGGLDENKILELNEVVDAYGIGTSISNAPVLDFSMDIVEIEGKPFAKRGKLSGKKEIYRCPECFKTIVNPYNLEAKPICECNKAYLKLLQLLMDKGKIIKKYPSSHQLREYVLQQLEKFSL